MPSLNHRWTYADRRGNDPKLFLGNDRSLWFVERRGRLPSTIGGRTPRGGGTALNSSSGTTVHFGLLRGADDFPKPSVDVLIRIFQNPPPEDIPGSSGILQKILRNPQESSGILQNPPESSTILCNPPKSSGILRNPPSSGILQKILRNPPESSGILRNPPKSSGILMCTRDGSA